ncbi:hypothetical protein TWF102_006961 [Orbilia oligospora]|uniref:Uncharacterized protein n=1 Tax=Orbilia oligospora TaxID=2813651 RepID=A0A7C8JKP0_ORBOL|nr:hypothetical protein TWF102_006961 [Orbilia oligospora]
MSGRNFRTPSTSAESSQAAFETAVEVLSGFREENPTHRRQEPSAPWIPQTAEKATDEPPAPWIPRTAEEAAYDRCEKLSTTTSMANVRRDLGIPSGTKHNDYVWQQLSDLVDEAIQELNYEIENLANLTKISQKIQNSGIWKYCDPQRPASAYVPILIYRWKKSRWDPKQRRGFH